MEDTSSLLPPPINASSPHRPCCSGSPTRLIENAPDVSTPSAAGNFIDDSTHAADECMSADPGVLRAYLLWYFKQGPSQWYFTLYKTLHIYT